MDFREGGIMKRKASKVGDRVIATRKMGSIRQGDAGKVGAHCALDKSSYRRGS